MVPRHLPSLLVVIGVVALAGSAARADDAYRRLTVTTNAFYLLVPVYQLDAELAVNANWSVAVRGGAGRSELGGEPHTITELGGRAVYYPLGNVDRGLQLGIDARFVTYEGGGMLMGLGDGFALGPIIGYKRAFGSGLTLGARISPQVALTGRSDGPVIAYAAASIGWSFWATGERAAPRETRADLAAHTNPLDHHRGALFGVALGLGAAVIEGCDACKLEPGLAVNAALGWFLHRRVALVIDANALVAVLTRSRGFGAFGFGLTSLAVQVWPHEAVWLKLGVGAAQLTSTALGGTGFGVEAGGGGTLAAGYEFHHDRAFGMDLQLAVTHGSFEPVTTTIEGVDTFSALVGVHWY